MSKTYLEVGAGTTRTNRYRFFGYKPEGLNPHDKLVLADLQEYYPDEIDPRNPYKQPARINLSSNKYTDQCDQNGVELAHVYTDGRQLSFADDAFDEVLFRNVFSRPMLELEDAERLLAEARRVSVGGTAVPCS